MHPEQKKLHDIIADRNCLVIANGPSAGQLEGVDLPKDLCYCGVNKFWPVQFKLLQPLHFSVIWVAAPARIQEERDNIVLQLDSYPSVWITRFNAYKQWVRLHSGDTRNRLRDKTVITLCENGDRPSDPETAWDLFKPPPWDVLSAGALIVALLKCGVEKVGVIGMDGYRFETMYFSDENYSDKEKDANELLVKRDTEALSKHWPVLIEDEDLGEVANFNEESMLECWPKMTLLEGLEWIG